MSQKASVALCLIMRDEETFLLSCLNSVRHLVDTMVIVDTGSEDRSVALAREAGAEVYHFPWSGNFAQARNFALEQATSDWILVLDADEVLQPVNRASFQELLHEPEVEGYFLTLENRLGLGREATQDQVVRLFRNKPAYRFAGAIHEQIAASILQANGNRSLAKAALVIRHYGYLPDSSKIKDKFSRNTGILIRELEHSPDDPFLLYCLGLEYYRQNNIAQGLPYLEKALVHMPGSEGYLEDVILSIACGYLHQLYRHEATKVIDFISKSLLMFPQHPDLLACRGWVHYRAGHRAEALADFQAARHLGGSRLLPVEFL